MCSRLEVQCTPVLCREIPNGNLTTGSLSLFRPSKRLEPRLLSLRSVDEVRLEEPDDDAEPPAHRDELPLVLLEHGVEDALEVSVR